MESIRPGFFRGSFPLHSSLLILMRSSNWFRPSSLPRMDGFMSHKPWYILNSTMLLPKAS